MHDEDSLWNSIPYELKCKGEIECYDKLNELHPKYPIIIYTHAIRYKQRQRRKDWLYPQQMIQAIKKVIANSIILVFSPTNLSNLLNYR